MNHAYSPTCFCDTCIKTRTRHRIAIREFEVRTQKQIERLVKRGKCRGVPERGARH